MTKKGKIAISSFKHQVTLCSMNDVVIDNEVMSLNRVAALPTWAHIEAKAGSSYSPTGYAIKPEGEKQTHIITIRTRRNIDFSVSAWIYEARLQSAPRWFKILKYFEREEYTVFSCRIIQRSDDISKPVEPAAQNGMLTTMPQEVKL